MKKKIVLITSLSIVGLLAISVAIPFIILGIKTSKIKTSWDEIKTNETYNHKVEIEGINLVEQHISCGYASIEMVSEYYGNKVSEDDLDKKNNGGVSTSSTKGFLNEINESIPSKTFTSETYLTNSNFLKGIHSSLSNNNPVTIEWAAKYKDEWTLHFSVVTGLDISSDSVTVYNPYGYVEAISINDFLDRTTFEAYENMPLFLNFGFAFGGFHKNTIFYAK